MKLLRKTEAVDELVNTLCKLGRSFALQHGTYTTKLITENGTITFSTTKFSNKVFIAAKMIQKDVVNSAKGHEIMQSRFSKANFENGKQNDGTTRIVDVLNIDLSGAYARCLFVNKLITDKTYNYLLTLKKEERLPAVGMLARSYTIFNYECGECTDISVSRSATAQIFFYLISEIDSLMQSIKWILGRHFIFYWVDGVFFHGDTPKSLITKVEKTLNEANYLYKYEHIEHFKLKKKNDLFTIEMHKNGEFKRYKFTDSTVGKEIGYMLQEKSKNYSFI
jgi:hypothetical protein